MFNRWCLIFHQAFRQGAIPTVAPTKCCSVFYVSHLLMLAMTVFRFVLRLIFLRFSSVNCLSKENVEYMGPEIMNKR